MGKRRDAGAETGKFLQSCSRRVEQHLEEHFRGRQNPGGLMDAIRYSSLGGGKKIRPALAYAAARALGLAFGKMDNAACAIELIHAYSLIHDDLPAMDDDDMRRGRPTLHKAFGEALAILAGDAMQTMAFEILATSPALDHRRRTEAVALLARAAGTEGMASGQIMDIMLAEQTPDVGTVEAMHRLKTGSLISACVRIALLCADDLSDATQHALEEYAEHIGLCFQIRDDVLDLKADSSDGNHATYPAVLGLEATEKELQRVAKACLTSLETLDSSADTLRLLTHYVAEREV